MGIHFKKTNEASERLLWKVLMIVLIPAAMTAIVAGSVAGLALRSGSLAMPDFVTWARLVAVLGFIMVFVGGMLIRHGFIKEGLNVPFVRASIPLLVFFAGLLFTGIKAERQFFSTSAEIIPVLLLALAIEGRAFSLVNFPTTHWLGKELFKISSIATMMVLASGEAFALAATTQAAPSPLASGIVIGGLGAGFAGVMTFSVIGQLGAGGKPQESSGDAGDDTP